MPSACVHGYRFARPAPAYSANDAPPSLRRAFVVQPPSSLAPTSPLERPPARASPGGRPPLTEWPIETRVGVPFTPEELQALRRSKPLRDAMLCRSPLPLAELEQRMGGVSARLAALNEPPLSLEEAIGGRLYTGPLYMKYNTVLRGLDSPVDFLRARFASLCGGNRYTTTLHAINSLIVKTSKLTMATPVYRGVSGRMLPDAFWRPNGHGVRGGVEAAFMSTPARSKRPSWQGHIGPPRSPQTALEGLRLLYALGRRGLAAQTTAGSDGSSARGRPS